MAEQPKLLVSVSPHIQSEETVAKIMWSVNISLIPAFLMSVYYFGIRALAVITVSILSAVATEVVVQRLSKKKVTISDGSAFITGLLLAFNLPSGVPLWIPVIGNVVAIAITKQIFGGLGYNIFNPALMGRAFLLASWPRVMTTWYEPSGIMAGLDVKTTATPLAILKEEGMGKLIEVFGDKTNLYTELFIGHRAGSLGETSIIALLIGAAYLIYKGYITWHIPASFLGTVAVLTWIFGGKNGLFTGDPLLSLISGGLILGAFYMATDYVTCPSVRKAQMLFGLGAGVITVLIRLKGGYPEGVCYAILLMNCFTPMLDRRFKTEKFGLVRVKEGGK